MPERTLLKFRFVTYSGGVAQENAFRLVRSIRPVDFGPGWAYQRLGPFLAAFRQRELLGGGVRVDDGVRGAERLLRN